MAIEQNAPNSLLDALYCEEEEEDYDERERETTLLNESKTTNVVSLSPLLHLDQDFFWDDEELKSLFSKERETSPKPNLQNGFSLSKARKESVEWILKVNAHYGFSSLTAFLAVNYLDRFLCTLNFAQDKPWMMQLAAVTCFSLAAKVEETYVPLLLDLQVEGAKYFFEAKTIQRMELLILSGLQWRMNPVTPISFLDHIIRRLGLKSYVHWELLRSCENLLLSVISDPRFCLHLPSVLATATMLHVVHRFEPCNAVEYQNQLLGVLKINKDEVDECYEVITEVLNTGLHGSSNGLKRGICQVPGSPEGEMGTVLNSDSPSEDSDSDPDPWGVESCVSQPMLKKRRVQEQQRLASFSCRVFVDAVGSPH